MESLANAPSLLNYLDAPIAVADPDGRVVFVNPAFAARFATTQRRSQGRPLAELFEGGDREAVLAGVAATCARGQSVRFRIRHRESGFQVLASPITVEEQRVGSLLLLTEEQHESEGLHRLRRVLGGALEQLTGAVERLARSDGQLADGERDDWAASARGGLADLRRAAGQLDRLADGQRERQRRDATLDPNVVLRDALAGVAYEMAEGGVRVEMILAGDLPLVRGDGKRLQEALEAMLRSRIAAAVEWITVGGRTEQAGAERWVLLTVTDPDPGAGAAPTLAGAAAALGGTFAVETVAGQRVAVVRLPAV